jgi:hypothetical protein
MTDLVGVVWVGRVLVALFSFSLGVFVLTASIENVPMIYAASMLVGVVQFGFEAYFLVLISRYYQGKFSVFSFCLFFYSLTLIIFEIAMVSNGNKFSLNTMLMIGLLALPTMLGLEWLPEERDK